MRSPLAVTALAVAALLSSNATADAAPPPLEPIHLRQIDCAAQKATQLMGHQARMLTPRPLPARRIATRSIIWTLSRPCISSLQNNSRERVTGY